MSNNSGVFRQMDCLTCLPLFLERFLLSLNQTSCSIRWRIYWLTQNPIYTYGLPGRRTRTMDLRTLSISSDRTSCRCECVNICLLLIKFVFTTLLYIFGCLWGNKILQETYKTMGFTHCGFLCWHGTRKNVSISATWCRSSRRIRKSENSVFLL